MAPKKKPAPHAPAAPAPAPTFGKEYLATLEERAKASKELATATDPIAWGEAFASLASDCIDKPRLARELHARLMKPAARELPPLVAGGLGAAAILLSRRPVDPFLDMMSSIGAHHAARAEPAPAAPAPALRGLAAPKKKKTKK